MARRKKTSPIEDLIDIGAMLPWKAGVVLAIVSYFGFHYVATMQNAAPQGLNGMGEFVGRQLFITFSTFLQYIVPVALLIGAGLSVYRGKHRRQLVDQQSGIESIRAMPWQEFELLVGEAFRRQGFRVEEHGGSAPDGGIDLVLYKDGKKAVVQCKRWKTYSINVSLVRELYGVMTAEGADACIFVTSGSYTVDALDFARDKPIRLIDGDELVQVIRQVQQQRIIGAGNSTKAESLISATTPSCPQCGSTMVRRKARKGANAGNEFWGCSRFPACRGVR